jgi:hypothetical protein
MRILQPRAICAWKIYFTIFVWFVRQGAAEKTAAANARVVMRNDPMTRHQYIIGLNYFSWGLIWAIPLFLGFNLSDALILIPIVCLFMLTGIGIIKNKRFAWTFVLVLGLLTFLHFLISLFNEIFKVTDIRGHGIPETILFFVWLTIILLTLYSTIRVLKQDIRTKFKINSGQVRLTVATCLVTCILWTLYLLNDMHWN